MTDEHRAFIERLFKLYHKKLKKYAYFHLNDAEMAEDIVTEVFLTAICKVDELYTHSNHIGWLFTVANNKIKNYNKSQYKKNRDILGRLKKVLDTVDNECEIPDEYDLEKDVLSSIAFNEYIEALNDNEQQYIIDKFQNDMSVIELSQKMGKSESAVKQMWQRLKEKIKHKI